jgi:hypothetical protein
MQQKPQIRGRPMRRRDRQEHVPRLPASAPPTDPQRGFLLHSYALWQIFGLVFEFGLALFVILAFLTVSTIS